MIDMDDIDDDDVGEIIMPHVVAYINAHPAIMGEPITFDNIKWECDGSETCFIPGITGTEYFFTAIMPNQDAWEIVVEIPSGAVMWGIKCGPMFDDETPPDAPTYELTIDPNTDPV